MQVDRVDAHRRWRRESSAFTNEGKSQKPQRSGWTLLPLSDCGTHSVGRHAGRGRVARGNLTPGLPQNPGVTVSRHRALLTSYQYARTHRQWANRPGCLESSPVHHRLNRLKVRSRLYFFPAQRLR